jgi:cytochrome P450
MADPGEETKWAAEEGLRWNAPVALLPRHNPREVEWHGIPIPADTPLLFAIASANRDPAVFDDPDRFDIDRRSTNTLAFGFGTHFCLGAHLARAEIETSLQVLCRRLPRMQLVPDGDVRIGSSFVQLLRGPNRLPVRFD